jgi:hypothetical protein
MVSRWETGGQAFDRSVQLAVLAMLEHVHRGEPLESLTSSKQPKGFQLRIARAEIAKALRAAPKVAHGVQAIGLREALGEKLDALCEVAANLLECEQAELEEFLQRIGHGLLDVPETPVEDVPSDLFRTVPFLSYTDGVTDGRKALLSLNLVAAAARGGPEQFYLPREWVKRWRLPWTPALTQLVLDPIRKAERVRRVPAVRKEVPGPNQPCCCGSGRKFKKCRGAPGKRTPDA